MRTAPPTVPGMLTPNSIPLRPQFTARALTAGRRAPPPHTTRQPSRSIAARARLARRRHPPAPAHHPQPLALDRAQLAVQLEHEPQHALVGDEQVRPRAD